MFRSTTTIVASTLTFSTVEDYQEVIKTEFNHPVYVNRLGIFTADNKLLNRTCNLTDNQTLTLVMDWDSEASFNEFYIPTDQEINDDIEPEFVRTVTTETI